MTATESHHAPTAPKTSYWREIWRRREFAWFLAMGRLRARNASTTLGLVWWVLNPLLLAGIYFLVFGFIFNARRSPGYLSYLLSGIFPFYFTSGAMTGAVGSILGNAKLLANLNFPRLVLPMSAIVESGVGFLTSLFPFFIIAALGDGILPTRKTLLLIPIFVLFVVFNSGLAALTARLAVPFRDVNNLVPYVLRLWLYLTPILFPLSFLDGKPAALRAVVEANPLFAFLSVFRSAMADHPFDPMMLLLSAAWAIGVFAIGVWTFTRAEGHMVRHL